MKRVMRTCFRCNEDKPETEFYRGYECKSCRPKYKGVGRARGVKVIPSDIPGNRICFECRQDLPLDDFPLRSMPDGSGGRKKFHQCRCKPCDRIYRAAAMYGLTVSEYNAIHDRQGGKCAICKKLGTLVIDHCHDTLEVRGLLCHGCNIGIAILDNEKRYQAATDYLGWEDND